jgi:tetratricopeptide (TPR) repeat protein
MPNDPNRCLAAPEILAYVNGELAEGRKADVERHLDDCRLCGDAVEGVAGLEWREGFAKSAETVLFRVRARTAAAVTEAAARRPAAPRRYRPAPRYLALAASLVVGVWGAAAYLLRPGPGEALFSRAFEPYPVPNALVRGPSGGGGSSKALALYEAGDYQRALAALEATLARDPNDLVGRFYAGLCQLALGRSQEAALSLERVRQLGDPELRTPAEWYLALAELRGRDVVAARARLIGIVEGRGFYEARARTLLAELDDLQ